MSNLANTVKGRNRPRKSSGKNNSVRSGSNGSVSDVQPLRPVAGSVAHNNMIPGDQDPAYSRGHGDNRARAKQSPPSELGGRQDPVHSRGHGDNRAHDKQRPSPAQGGNSRQRKSNARAARHHRALAEQLLNDEEKLAGEEDAKAELGEEPQSQVPPLNGPSSPHDADDGTPNGGIPSEEESKGATGDASDKGEGCDGGVTAEDYTNFIRPLIRVVFMCDMANPDRAALRCYNRAALWVSRSRYQGIDYIDLTKEVILEVYAQGELPVTQEIRLWRWVYAFRHTPVTTILERPKTCAAVAVAALVTTMVAIKRHPLIVAGAIGLAWLGRAVLRQRTAPAVSINPFEMEDKCCIDCPLPDDFSGVFKPTPTPTCIAKPVYVGFTIAPKHVWVPRGCSHNEENALKTRQLLPALSTPKVRAERYGAAFCLLQDEMKIPEVEMSAEAREAFMAHLTTTQRRMVEKAIETCSHVPTARTKAFVKREVLTEKKLVKENPRLISSKEVEYFAEVGPEYYTWQKQVTQALWATPELALQQKFIYPGAMTGDQIGEIVTYFENLGWHALEADYSRYDGHTEREALEAEMEFYRNYLSDEEVEFLKLQLDTKGRTMTGHKFKCKGKRASGVANTTFGNTFIGFAIAALILAEMEVENFCVMQLGDDNIIFTQHKVDVGSFVERAAAFGHKLEMVYRAPDEYDFLEFCSQRFYDVGDSRVLGPKIGRVLAKTFISTTKVPGDDMKAYVTGIAKGFKYYNWLPILGPLCQQIENHGHEAYSCVNRNPYKIHLRREIEVDPQAVAMMLNRVYGTDFELLETMVLEMDVMNNLGCSFEHEAFYQILEIDGVVPSGDAKDFLG